VRAIVGTSIGALLGAAYADGISVGDLCDLGRRVRIRDFLRFQTSHAGHDKQKKDCIGQFVQEWFRTQRLEELSIPTAIVSTDLDTGAPFVLTKGPLEVAIRASCAFPGLVKPVEYEGRLLGDGCIAAAVPTAIAAGMYGGFVLGVSVGSSLKSSSSGDIVKIFNSDLRSSVERIMAPTWCRRADILLEPQVQHIDWNDFTQVDEAFSAGAEAMRRALSLMRELLAHQPRGSRAHAQGMSFAADRGSAC